jgi:hypothetical protein
LHRDIAQMRLLEWIAVGISAAAALALQQQQQ